MNDPYAVLGISANASNQEVKSAFRSLAKQYHPDKHHNTPMATLAEETMKDINKAYQSILSLRENLCTPESSSYDSSPYFMVENLLAQNKPELAKQMLEHMQYRDAQWHRLYGRCCGGKGWNKGLKLKTNRKPRKIFHLSQNVDTNKHPKSFPFVLKKN